MEFYAVGDLLGLAVTDKIVLVEPPNGGLRQDPIRVMDRVTGKYVSAGTKVIRPRYEYSCAYDLIDASANLSLSFGAAVNTNYFLTGATIRMSNGAWCRVQVPFMKFSAAAKFNATDSRKFSIDVPDGYGVVDLLGCTVTGGEAIEGQIQVNVNRGGDNLLGATSADYQTGAVTLYGAELVKSLTATAAITLPAGAKNISTDVETAEDGAKIYKASWIEYPTYT